MYNLPGCTTNDLLPETVSKLARVDNIIGIKNSMSDIFRLTRLVDETPEDFDVIIGSDPIILPAMLSGAKGMYLEMPMYSLRYFRIIPGIRRK